MRQNGEDEGEGGDGGEGGECVQRRGEILREAVGVVEGDEVRRWLAATWTDLCFSCTVRLMKYRGVLGSAKKKKKIKKEKRKKSKRRVKELIISCQ